MTMATPRNASISQYRRAATAAPGRRWMRALRAIIGCLLSSPSRQTLLPVSRHTDRRRRSLHHGTTTVLALPFPQPDMEPYPCRFWYPGHDPRDHGDRHKRRTTITLGPRLNRYTERGREDETQTHHRHGSRNSGTGFAGSGWMDGETRNWVIHSRSGTRPGNRWQNQGPDSATPGPSKRFWQYRRNPQLHRQQTQALNNPTRGHEWWNRSHRRDFHVRCPGAKNEKRRSR